MIDRNIMPASDSKNVYFFRNEGVNGVLGYAFVWRDTITLEILEYDVIINTAYPIGDGTVNNVFDLESLVAHETGHGLGLDHANESSCNNVTMYGGPQLPKDISRRNLEIPDIIGLNELYHSIGGDSDFDGDVDLSDLGVLSTNYGMTSGAFWHNGDFDKDGDVDLSDLGVLSTNYGTV